MAIHKSHPDHLIYWREATNDETGATEEAICDTCDETVAKLIQGAIKPTLAGRRTCN